MALFWRSGRSESLHHKHKNTVPVVENNQQLNPFTEINVFTDHTDIVRHLLQVDATRTTDLTAGKITDCLVSIPSSNLFCSACEQLCLWNSDWEIEHRIKPNEDVQINHVLQLSDNRLVVSVASELMVYKVVSSVGQDTGFQLQLLKNCLPPHRENIRCLVNISDSCFGSASLDGAIRVWATRALNYTQEFNQVEDYKVHCNYPHSVQYLLPMQERYLFAAIASGFSLYDVFTGNCLVHMLNAHYSSVTSLSMVYGGEFLATSSEDGTIRLWSSYEKSIPASDLSVSSDPVFQREISSFFQTTRPSAKHGRQTYQPSLLGECVAHSGGINTFLDYGQEGLVSCGADSLLILWKDGVRQSCKRNKLIRENLFLNGFKDDCYRTLNTGLEKVHDQATDSHRQHESPGGIWGVGGI
ncbi:WD repeat-containing protein 41-like [Anneissia japonica]|uniref:WD repeat-containing protein 41-like n=1 Tax=Anneissia japonica TaxID=1529436 RepID=UPI001425B585|nr:WD repeat-containing protein 41-like [Anneissia japonica]